MPDYDWATLNPVVIEEYRATGTVERFGGMPLMIVHAIGAKTGFLREIPLFPVSDGDRTLLYGTAGGSPKHPGWVHNLRAHPDVTIEFGGEMYAARMDELPVAESQAMLEAHAETTPLLAEYLESAAPRVVPVFEVTRVSKTVS